MTDKVFRSTRPPPSAEYTELQEEWVRRGYWSTATLAMALERALTKHSTTTVEIRSRTRPHSGSFRELLDASRRFARALQSVGVLPGDPVLIQLPNWLEQLVCFTGTMLAGGVAVPLAPFYGSRERTQIANAVQPKVSVLPTRFQGRDFTAEVLDAPAAATTVFVGCDAPMGGLHLNDWLSTYRPLTEGTPVAASDIAVIAFSSGTTGTPKGVLLSHRSLVFEATEHGPIVLPEQAPALTPSPLGHVSGLISGFLVPALRGNAIHLVDHWSPADAADAARTASLSVGSGAPVFLQTLLEVSDPGGGLFGNTSVVTLGGASISPAFCARVQQLGIDVIRVYGSTEHPVCAGATVADPPDKRVTTDGRALPGVELRIVDDVGQPLAAGAAGELWTRGPDSCDGYLDPDAAREAFTSDGWFRTGDIGVLDEDGWLTIVDRKKDIIIRHGLNISARELELAIAEHPSVMEVAVVGRSCSRTGERVVAVVRQLPGSPDLGVHDIGVVLGELGLARFKWPEELIRVSDFPRTASGKVSKAELRANLPQVDGDKR